MAEEITTMLAQPFRLPAGVAVTVTDSGAGSPRTVSLASDRVFRTFLADTDADTGTGINAGTEDDPDEWLRYLQYKLNADGALALWTVTMTAAGRVRFDYSGTGFGTIDWNGSGGTSVIPRYVSGFADDVACSAGGSDTGAQQPLYCVFSIAARTDATNWAATPRRSAIATDDTGATWALAASRVARTFTSTWRFHPYDATARDELGAAGTVYQPSDTARWTTPPAIGVQTASTTVTLPWSLLDAFSTVHGVRCGVALGTFQRLVAANEYGFFDVSLAASTLQAEQPFVPTAADWAQRIDWKGVTLNYRSTESR